MAEKDGSTESLRAAIRALRRSTADAEAAVEATEDGKRAYEGATKLSEELRRAYESAARLRGRQAARIYDEQNLSLAGLADYLGISKARANQFVDGARRERGPKT